MQSYVNDKWDHLNHINYQPGNLNDTDQADDLNCNCDQPDNLNYTTNQQSYLNYTSIQPDDLDCSNGQPSDFIILGISHII